MQNWMDVQRNSIGFGFFWRDEDVLVWKYLFYVIVLWSTSNLNQETCSTSAGVFERKLNLCIYLVGVPYYMYIFERGLRPLHIFTKIFSINYDLYFYLLQLCWIARKSTFHRSWTIVSLVTLVSQHDWTLYSVGIFMSST